MKNITVIGIDIAKNFMQLHGADNQGKALLKKRLSREKFLVFMANVPRCLIGMEACAGSHYWAEELIKLGFEVKLMSARKVKKFVENHKNDAIDAKACAEAVTRGDMTFVPIKSKSQLEIQGIHRARSNYIKQRTGTMNMVRGFLLENGIAIAKGKKALMKKVTELLGYDNDQFNQMMKGLLEGLMNSVKQLDKEIRRLEAWLKELADQDGYCQRMMTLPGVGPITATALIAKIGKGNEFRKGRELSAYLGLVPKQYSSGNTHRLVGISKHGDRYLRQLLIHGGRSCLRAVGRKNKVTGLYEREDVHSQWMRNLMDRVGMNKASVAIANKNARMIVVLLKKQTHFQPALAHQRSV